MTQVVVRPDTTRALAELLRDPKDLIRVYIGLKTVIGASFNEERKRSGLLTYSDVETRRRFEICVKWFRIFRGDLGWTLDRALDFLPLALRKELDGEAWEPPRGEGAWSPEVIQNMSRKE